MTPADRLVQLRQLSGTPRLGLVGESHPEGLAPFAPPSGYELAGLMGTPLFAPIFYHQNVYVRPPKVWSPAFARRAALRLVNESDLGKCKGVIFFGTRVAQAFGLYADRRGPETLLGDRGDRLWVAPAPGRWYTYEKNRRAFAELYAQIRLRVWGA